MSFTRKIIDGARSGLNTVMDRIAADDTPLSYVDESLLASEVKARRELRQSRPRPPGDNPRARIAGASAGAREQRAQRAEHRARRVHAHQEQEARKARKAQEEAFRQAKQRAYSNASSGPRASSRASSASGAGSSRRRAGGFPFGKNDAIAAHYKTLDLPYGAGFDEVKKSYRALMRKYHPDRHVGNAKKQKAATELTMRVTQAYNALEEHLKKNPNHERR